MATGAASRLAGLCGWHVAVAPLLWLAIAESAWIAGRAAVRRRGHVRVPVMPCPAIRAPAERAGLLTVPLGLAVTTTGLASQDGAFASSLALAGLAATWLSAVVLLLRFLGSATGAQGLAALDGSWFLAPAVLLGGSIAAVACVPHVDDTGQALLRGLAVAAAVSGIVSYGGAMAAAAVRVSRYGLDGTQPVLWWISAGCGGLAAAALGASGGNWSALLSSALRTAAAVTWVTAIIALVPIVVQGTRFLGRKRPVMRPAPWPPAFSTGVIALGTIGVGTVLHLSAITVAGRAAGIVTLIVWAVTTSWNAAVLGRRFYDLRSGGVKLGLRAP